MQARLTIETSSPIRVTSVTRLNTDATFDGPKVGETITASADYVMGNEEFLPHGVGVEVHVEGVDYPANRATLRLEIPAVGEHKLSTTRVTGFNEVVSGTFGGHHYWIRLNY